MVKPAVSDTPRPAICILILSCIIFFTFLPGLAGEFLNWDDSSHLVGNDAVRHMDIPLIFRQTVQKVYIPLTTLSFAVEYRFFGENSFVYHLNNLILQIFNSVLVYFLGIRLGLVSRAAFAAALIFGIHPMRVESVAWITERKDLLYAFFYLLSMLEYLEYQDKQKVRNYASFILLAILSLLSKPMALSLPIIFFILDWFRRREFVLKIFLEKLPLLLIFIPIVWMTFRLHVRNPIHNIGEALLNWVWTFNFYLWKFIWPLDLVPIHHAPGAVSLHLQTYTLSLIFFVLLGGIVFYLRKYRWVIFSVLFYLCSIFFLLRFDQAKDINIVADRFMYLPSLGFCFLIGLGFHSFVRKTENHKLNRNIVILIFWFVAGSLSFKSMLQTKVWNNSVELWTQVIRYYPQEFIAYNDRAVAFIFKGRRDLALDDYGMILKFDPGNVDAHFNRGLLLQKMELHQRAIDDFNQVILQYPSYEKAYHYRGASFEALFNFQAAVQDYNRTIKTNPAYVEGYLSRGNLFNQLGLLDKAVEDYRRVIEIDPLNAKVINNCGTVYAKLMKDKEALEYFNQAIALDTQYADAYYNRSVIFLRQGKNSLAWIDARKAKLLGADVPQEYLDDLKKASDSR